jgi:short-subunit dehydrogenase
MIVGGLGGIGRSIATWMVSRGAKNLVLLSRNTSSLSSDTLQWLQDLRESNDTTIRVEKCDVADESQLASSLAAIKTDLPPVKGIIHGGMVLRVCSHFYILQTQKSLFSNPNLGLIRN